MLRPVGTLWPACPGLHPGWLAGRNSPPSPHPPPPPPTPHQSRPARHTHLQDFGRIGPHPGGEGREGGGWGRPAGRRSGSNQPAGKGQGAASRRCRPAGRRACPCACGEGCRPANQPAGATARAAAGQRRRDTPHTAAHDSTLPAADRPSPCRCEERGQPPCTRGAAGPPPRPALRHGSPALLLTCARPRRGRSPRAPAAS